MTEQNWSEEITPKNSLFDLDLRAVWKFRDLLLMFVKRDFVSVYKQSILGPLWFFIQPIFTTIVYVFVFGNLAGISTDSLPKTLFYMSGTVCWGYFSDCLTTISKVFETNKAIFGKVYFPRLIAPLSVVISKLFKLGIQILLFLAFLVYYMVFTEYNLHFSGYILLFPYLLLLMGILGLGLGLLITSMTNKYKDFNFLLQFGVQLLMYTTTVIYPLRGIDEEYRFWVKLNPMTSIIETFRYATMGQGDFSWSGILYSSVFALIVMVFGVLVFNRTQKSFMDTV